MKRVPAMLAIAALALTGCEAGTSHQEPLLPPTESIDHYSAVLDEVADSLAEAYPEATISTEPENPVLAMQDDGECVLFLPDRTIDLNLFLESRDISLEALQSALDANGFGDLSDVQQTGPVRTSHAEDPRGAEFRANDRDTSEFSIRVPVHSGTCSSDDLPS